MTTIISIEPVDLGSQTPQEWEKSFDFLEIRLSHLQGNEVEITGGKRLHLVNQDVLQYELRFLLKPDSDLVIKVQKMLAYFSEFKTELKKESV